MSRKLIRPTDEEDAAITAAALNDPDAQPLTDEELKQLRPMRGRPLGSGTKVQMTVRFDVDVIQAFRQAGDGWQTRMNDALRDWLTTHPVV
jgi:uncharacterized protein (DUF4415 family)